MIISLNQCCENRNKSLFLQLVFYDGIIVCSTIIADEFPPIFLADYPMKDSSLGAKLIASLVAISSVLWFGGSIIRYSIAYDVFLPGTLIFKEFLTLAEINSTIRLFAVSGFYTAVCYSVAWVFSIILMINFRKKLKLNGWLFMAFMLFFLSSPIEIYQLWFDIRLIQLTQHIDYRTLMTTNDMSLIFLERFSSKLNGIGFISILANLTALLYFVWQPLKKSSL